MAGLDGTKKRSNSSSARVSRFGELLDVAQESTQKSGYPDSQISTQQDIQVTEQASLLDVQKSGYPDTQLPEQQGNQMLEHQLEPTNDGTQKSGYPDIQAATHKDVQLLEQSSVQVPEKSAKRDNPEYTQTTFRIPKKLSRQINRVLMDLADEGEEIDRSDLLEQMAEAFIRLADNAGAIQALEVFRNLGTQVHK